MFTRERHRRGTVYFGPYANAKKVRETLDVLNRVFRFRPCEGPRPGRHSGIPCLDFHIDRCFAPCIGAISQEGYAEIIDGVIGFLSGRHATRSSAELEERMREAAADERFEEAARYRNRLFSIRHLARAAGGRPAGRRDASTSSASRSTATEAAVQVFPLRDGKMIDRYGFHLENVAGEDAQSVLEAFVIEYYGAAPSTPPEVLVPAGDRRHERDRRVPAASGAGRASTCARRCAARSGVSSSSPSRTPGSRSRRTRRMREATRARRGSLRSRSSARCSTSRACRFGSSASTSRTSRASRSSRRWSSSWTAVRRTRTTARFAIRGLDGQDDVGAMREAIARRFARARDGEPDESFSRDAEPRRRRRREGAARGALGGDGGARPAARRGHRAREARGGGLRPGVPGADRARALEPGAAAPAADPRRGPSRRAPLPPAQAGRRGRWRRSSRRFPASGPSRRRAILRHFGSVERFLEASQEELEGVPGLPQKTARALYAQLHKAGPS